MLPPVFLPPGKGNPARYAAGQRGYPRLVTSRPDDGPGRHRPGRRPLLTWRRSVAIGAAVLAILAGAIAVAASVSGSGTGHAHAASRDRRSATTAPSDTPARRPAMAVPPIGVLGSYPVSETRTTFIEPPGTMPGGMDSGVRVLPVVVRYPHDPAAQHAAAQRAAGLFPLIVFAPGFLQCDGSYAFLLSSWASAGYVVAAVTFPHTSCHDESDADEQDLVNQPADVSFVIAQLLGARERSAGPLAGLVNPGEVAVAGQSDGGDTVAAVAGNSCCRNHLVKAAIVLAGAEWPLGGRYFASAAPPVLFVQGSADTVNPPWASLQLYQADTTGPRYYLDVLGASHLSPFEGSGTQQRLVAGVTAAFLDRYVAGQQAAGNELLRRGTRPGTAELVSGGALPPG